ncbi:MAG: colanic acid biosynthesis glycosyltransferase WcaI [Burkholderiales bacterium PBB5]|nr:MAG: colanic acid biosynthesis glycosyltransferase WcaI [Burkholderiales bacterium PBB5]
MAEWLAAQGHDVRVGAAPPYYPAWRVADAYRGRLYSREQRQGVAVWRAPLWVPQRAGGLARVLHLLSFAVTSAPLLLWWGLRWRPQVVMTVAPFFTAAPAALLAAKLAGARSWLHVQDFEIDVAFGMGLLKGGALKRAVSAVERFVFGRFDRVSSISQRMLERAASKGVPAERLVFFRNWVDVQAVQPMSTPSPYRAELGLAGDAVVVLFSGTLGSKQGLQIIPEVARLLADDPRIQFVVCGDGPMKPELLRQSQGLANVHFLPLQPVQRLGELLNLADIHLLPQDPAAEDLVLPSKLSGMLSSGRPVVATCAANTEMAKVVQGRGLVVAPGDSGAVAQAVAQLAQQPDGRVAMGQAARQFAVQGLGRDHVLQQCVEELSALVQDTARPARAA